MGVCERAALDGHLLVAGAADEEVRDAADGDDAGQPAESLPCVEEEPRRRRAVDPRDEQVLCRISGIFGLHTHEASREQQGNDDKRHRAGDLRDDEALLEPMPCSTNRVAATERCGGVGVRRRDRGQNAAHRHGHKAAEHGGTRRPRDSI